MLKILAPTTGQRQAVTDIVKEDLARRPLGYPLLTMNHFTSSIQLLVLSQVIGGVPENLAHGIPQSSAQLTSDQHSDHSTGMRSLDGLVAASLDDAIARNRRLTLLVPHAYALPREVGSLQGDFGGNVVALGENVYVRFEGSRSTGETIRRALASMISGYSVAWLFGDNGALREPSLALVPIFDADGFAMVASSQRDIELCFPRTYVG